ncbi:unnamed protein product [Prunus armeniaca]
MKTDSAGASENDSLADSVFGGQGSSAKVKGSRFDALRSINDSFGRDEEISDVFVEQDKSHFNSS